MASKNKFTHKLCACLLALSVICPMAAGAGVSALADGAVQARPSGDYLQLEVQIDKQSTDPLSYCFITIKNFSYVVEEGDQI